MLRAGGDAWAALIDMNATRLRRGGRPIFGYAELCREVAGVQVGELSVVALRSVVKRYAEACFETMRRKRRGERARYPRRRKALTPLQWYAGTFFVDGQRVRLIMGKGAPECWVRLTRPIPYPLEQVRSVLLVAEAGRLYLDVIAEVPVESNDLDPDRVAGVDLGIIHPYTAATNDEALVVSGRALRAQERLHLADTTARAVRMGRKTPKRGQRGSRRWRKIVRAQRAAEGRHRRRIRQGQHEAAKHIVSWAVERRIGTLVVGDPKGITNRETGRTQNRRLRQWRRTHLTRVLVDKATLAGIKVVLVNERGSSSTCPQCSATVAKPKGRTFSCKHCGLVAHRDVVGATNIAAKGGGSTSVPALVTHRRAGQVPARRDRRRHLMDRRRQSSPASGRPVKSTGSRSPRRSRTATSVNNGLLAPRCAALDEEPQASPLEANAAVEALARLPIHLATSQPH